MLDKIKTKIRKRVRIADKSFHVMVIAQMISDICIEYEMNPLRIIEEILRKIGSQTYLISIPADKNVKNKWNIKMPHDLNDDYDRSLYICLHGENEMEETLRKTGVTSYEENLKNLEITGMLTMKETVN